MSAQPYEDPGNVALMDLSDARTFPGAPRAADGVTATLTPETATAALKPAAVLAATNSGKVARNATWVRAERTFKPWLNLKDRQALGVWVEGDGRGEIIAFRLESPRHISFGAVADRYLTVDFTGRRFFTLIETESARWNDYVWNDGKGIYNVYRETIDFSAVESASLWYNNLPPGQEARCVIGAVKALPMISCIVKNPVVTVNGKAVVFPVELSSGGYLEFDGKDDCTLFGSQGETLGKVLPRFESAPLQPGQNQLHFTCEPFSRPAARARVVVIAHGEPL